MHRVMFESQCSKWDAVLSISAWSHTLLLTFVNQASVVDSVLLSDSLLIFQNNILPCNQSWCHKPALIPIAAAIFNEDTV